MKPLLAIVGFLTAMSGMVLDVKAKSTADNAQIIPYTSNGDSDQMWAMDAQ